MPQLDPAAALAASERLRAFVAARYPQGTPRFEWPVHAESGGQVTAGRVDLLVELPDGFVLIDHKSFPGALALDDDRLRAFAGQTCCYARALEAALGKPCVAVWAHQPVVGVEVQREPWTEANAIKCEWWQAPARVRRRSPQGTRQPRSR